MCRAAAASMPKNPRVLALFDVDGTLTEPRKTVSPETLSFLATLREKIAIGVVGGSDLVKQKEQLGDSPSLFDWCFAENGLLAHKDGVVIGQTSLVQHLGAARTRAARACRPHTAPHVLRLLPAAAGEENLKRLINWVLAYFAQLDIPVKRGTFVEFRQGARLIPRRCCSRPPPPALRRSSPHTCTHVSATAARDAPRRRALRAQACSTCRPSAATARARSETSLKSSTWPTRCGLWPRSGRDVSEMSPRCGRDVAERCPRSLRDAAEIWPRASRELAAMLAEM